MRRASTRCWSDALSAAAASLQQGLVVASHGRHVLVEADDGQRRICHPRGKRSTVVVGDRIDWLASQDEGSIERVHERRNLLYRQDEVRTKAFAANLDQVLVLLAAQPEFSESQLTRALIAAEDAGIDVLIGLNKRDLGPLFDAAWQRLAPYRQMGYTVLPLALKPRSEDAGSGAGAGSGPGAELLQALRGRTTLVLGPSGVGKSTLVNCLAPQAQVLTAEISQALNSGRHTTTSTTWYWLDRADGTALIDSPGFQEFGLHHIEARQLAGLMRDLREPAGHCRFHNCSHRHEPDCGVRALLEGAKPAPAADQMISANRYRIYSELYEELSIKRY